MVNKKQRFQFSIEILAIHIMRKVCCPCRIDGIVVAEENKELLMEKWRQEEQMMIEKEMKVGV